MQRTLSFGLALSALIALPAFAANVEVENRSSWDIHEIYFSPSSQEDWGEDYLGREVLKHGMTLTLTGVSSGRWDIRLVDEDADVCVLEDVRITASETWVVTDDDLLACQAATDE